MKKYRYSLIAISLALSLSAFTIPTTKKENSKDFRITGFNRTQSYVANPANWQNGMPNCPDIFTPEFEACRINEVDEDYYHEISAGLGVFKLNDAGFISSNRSGTVDSCDKLMNIPTSEGAISNNIYIVDITAGILSSGTQENRNDPDF